MKKNLFSVLSLSALLAAGLQAAPAAAAKAEPRALKAADGASLVVAGDSTLHKWKANATELKIEAELSKPGEVLAAIQAQGLSKLELVAQSAALKSEEGKSMDKNMHKAMNVKEHAEIRFSLTGYELKDGVVAAAGQLSIHGQTRDVVLPGSVTAKAGGVNVKGSYDLKMSDYGIKPPVMMMGTIRVADALTISYDFDLLP
jgi:polyisoprenoid-binding protein YceI